MFHTTDQSWHSDLVTYANKIEDLIERSHKNPPLKSQKIYMTHESPMILTKYLRTHLIFEAQLLLNKYYENKLNLRNSKIS